MYQVSSINKTGTSHRSVRTARAEAARRIAQSDEEVIIERATRGKHGYTYERVNLTAPVDLGVMVAGDNEDNPLNLPL